ncbi:MAG: gliding motility-associated C-terminal domain-containing protein [Bacteroidota bacterium]
MSLKIKYSITLLVLNLFVAFSCFAQICSGSLGDPVVNIDFGKGNNPGAALNVQLPNLSFTSIPCPDDGFYAIVNSTSACFNNSWHTISSDHTANDDNGYMMLINAYFNSGDFYVDTVRGLCGGTTYEFAAWVLNVLNSSSCGPGAILPNVTFNIESTSGTVLGTYNTTNISLSSIPEWKQYGLFFKTPANGSNVVLRITNIAPGGCGNDLALDDITFRPCGPSIQTAIVGTTNTSINPCIENTAPVALSATVSSGYNNPAYQWQRNTDGVNWNDIPGATTLFYTHQPSGAGIFRYRMVIAEAGNINTKNCRIASNEITISVQSPGKGIKSNSPVCTGENISLTGAAGKSFSWKGPNNFSDTSQNPVLPATIAAAGKYVATTTDEFGCIGRDSLLVVVNQSPVAQTTAAVNVCQNIPVQLNASGGTTFNWLPATGLSDANISNPVAILPDTTTYTLIVGNGTGCADTTAVTVNVIAGSLANAGPDKTIFEGQSTLLNGTVSGGIYTFQWTPNNAITDGNTLTPTVSPNDDLNYILQVQSTIGCGNSTDTVFVRVFKKITIPTAFSPNGDGINDTWRIDALVTYPEAAINVFDRYGRKIYSSTGYSLPWDGNHNSKPVPVGSYYYVIDLKNNLPVLAGSVFVIR